MRCPKCGKAHTRVVDSRMQESNNTIKRRRECCSCNYRFTTFERCEDLSRSLSQMELSSGSIAISCSSA